VDSGKPDANQKQGEKGDMKLYPMPEVRVAGSKVPSPAANAKKWEIGESGDVAKRSAGSAPKAGIAYPF
jgi:hypothetical protein